MIAKTPEEKEALKRAKAQYKNQIKIRDEKELLNIQERINKPRPILTGLLEKEHPLADDYPVYWDYLYVVCKGGVFNVIRSDIKGNVATLRKDLQKLYKVPIGEIFNCDLKARNLL